MADVFSESCNSAATPGQTTEGFDELVPGVSPKLHRSVSPSMVSKGFDAAFQTARSRAIPRPNAPSSTAWQLLHRFIERRVQDACESLMWAGSIFAKRLTQQGVALTTGALTVALPHKAASTAAAVGVTLTAALAFAPPIEGSPPSQTGAAKLPAVVEQALKENAQQLTPISVSSTTQMKTTLSPTEAFGQLKDQGV